MPLDFNEHISGAKGGVQPFDRRQGCRWVFALERAAHRTFLIACQCDKAF
jgi:hypothetical protein